MLSRKPISIYEIGRRLWWSFSCGHTSELLRKLPQFLPRNALPRF